MIKNLKFILLTITLFSTALAAHAQIPDSTWGKDFDNYPTFKFKGLFQSRFTSSLTKDVDVNGLHHEEGKFTSNSFAIKYMRVQVQAAISKRTEVVALVNLADFKSDPKTKVLENAYIKYSFGPQLGITVGQFRPWFGIEETHPVDVLKTLEWSNQYSEFGKNGWTSFQLGISAGGKTNLGKMPFQYALSVVNGNGKNQIADNNSGKQYMARVVGALSQKYGINLGLNGGLGDVSAGSVYAWGLDVTSSIPLARKWFLETQIEGKQALNHALHAATENAGDLGDYRMRGLYVLPNLRYEIKYKNLGSIEASCRYEYLDPNFHIASNPRQTYTPMIGLEFLKNYGARIQLGVQMDRYKHQSSNTTTHDRNLFVIQVQSRL